MNRIALGQKLANQGVTCLVIGRVATLFFGHDHAFTLRSHQDFVFGFFEVDHLHHAGVATGCHQGRFVAQVGKISTTHAWCTAGNHLGLHVLANRHFAHVHVQNLLTATDVWQGHVDLAVKTAWTQQSRIQNVRTVGRSNHDHTQVGFKTIHLDQHLVEGLFALVVAATQACATLATHRVNFVNKNDARRVLFGVLEHVANAGSTHTHKHLDKVRTGDAEKRHFRFASDAFGQQCFTCARRTHQKQTAGNAAAQFLEPLRIFQEVNHLFDFFFGFITTGHISKSGVVVVFVHHARLGLAKTERTAFATALHLAHEINPDTNQKQHGAPADQQCHEQGAFFTGLDIELDAAADQIAHQTTVQISSRCLDASVIVCDGDNFGATRALGNGGALDPVAANLFQKV